MKTKNTNQSKGIGKKKDRSHRPMLVLHEPEELRILKHRMEETEVTSVLSKSIYTGKKRGRKPKFITTTSLPMSYVTESLLYTPTNAAPAPIKGSISAAKDISFDAISAKRRPGRPLKLTPLITNEVVMGTPALIDMVIKRRPGRPAKVVVVTSISSDMVIKRRPGRPAKVVVVTSISSDMVVKRRPGRPAKVVVVTPNVTETSSLFVDEQLFNSEPTKTTKLDDYALFYSQKDYPDYKELLRYMQTYSIPVKQAIGLLSGAISIPTEEALIMFKLGDFKIKNLVHAEHAAKLRNNMRKSAPTIYYKASFTNALARVSVMKGFDDTQLQKNMDKFFMAVAKADTIDGFERQIIEIYNTNLDKNEQLVLSHS